VLLEVLLVVLEPHVVTVRVLLEVLLVVVELLVVAVPVVVPVVLLEVLPVAAELLVTTTISMLELDVVVVPPTSTSDLVPVLVAVLVVVVDGTELLGDDDAFLTDLADVDPATGTPVVVVSGSAPGAVDVAVAVEATTHPTRVSETVVPETWVVKFMPGSVACKSSSGSTAC
jgi:hypothetical protein